MRQDEHHTLMNWSRLFCKHYRVYRFKNMDHFDTYFKFEGEERVNNRPCYKIIIDNKDFAYENYTVGENESITSIAGKLHISEYMILEVNPKTERLFSHPKKRTSFKSSKCLC